MNDPQTLRDLLDLAISRHRTSRRQLAIKAQEAGFQIVDTTLNGIAAGTYKSQPKPETLRAIAWLAGVPEADAFTAAGLPVPGPPFADELPPGVDNLSPKARRAVIEMLRVLVDEGSVGGAGVAGPTPAAPGPPARPARNTRAWGGVTPPPMDELEARRRSAESRADEALENLEGHAAQPMPEGGTEYQKRVRAQDEAGEMPDGEGDGDESR